MSKSSITWYWFNLNNHFCPRHTCLVLTHSGFNANPAGFVGAKLGRLSGKPNMPACVQLNAPSPTTRSLHEYQWIPAHFVWFEVSFILRAKSKIYEKDMWVISFGPKQNISQGQPVGFVSYLQSSALFASTVGMQKIRQEQCQCKTSSEGPKPIVY